MTMLLRTVHSLFQARQQSKLLMDQVVLDAVGQFLLLNNNLQRVPCGTRNVSTVLNAIVRSTQCWLAMDLTRKFTVVLATVVCGDQKVNESRQSKSFADISAILL
jgi:hypothetical protein